VGLIEAVAILKQSLSSIGTTTAPFSISKNKNASALKWTLGLVNLMFEAQVEAALAQASLLVENHATVAACGLDRLARDLYHRSRDLDNVVHAHGEPIELCPGAALVARPEDDVALEDVAGSCARLIQELVIAKTTQRFRRSPGTWAR
jgi:hypothetical protein